MSLFDLFRYDGKRVVVVGAATGMGNAAARLLVDAGAEVVAMDYAPMDIDGIAGTITVNLADKASIDAAVDECGGRVDALFSCAGVADGTPGIEKINFLGHRHMINRMLDAGMLGRGSAIGFISSAAGAGWARDDNQEILGEYLAIEDMDEASQWALDNGKADYFQSKLAVCLYVAKQGVPAARRRASGSTPSCPGRPTRRSPRPTRRCGSGSVPTTARTPASRRRRPRIRRTRWCSCAATPPRRSPGSR